MSHANNGTSDLNAWIGIFGEFAKLMGMEASSGDLFQNCIQNLWKGIWIAEDFWHMDTIQVKISQC